MQTNRIKSRSLHNITMQLCFILKPIPGPSLSLPLLAFTINRLLYFGSSSAVSRSLTSSISSHLCCCAHTEIRRPTDISTVMLQCKHQQLSPKDQQTSFTSCLLNRGKNMTQSQFLLHATETSCHFSI